MIRHNYNIYRRLKKVCKTLKNVDMSNLTSLKVGGVADIVVYPTNIESIVKVVDIVKDTNYVVLGNMTNVLFGNYHGVVIVLGKDYSQIDVCDNVIVAQSGCALSKVCAVAHEYALTGMEALFGIPGSVGGAVVMNAGAFGSDISQVVTSVVALTDGKIKHYNSSECCFVYRSSAFENSIVLLVEFTLRHGNYMQIQQLMKHYAIERKNSQPLQYHSAGCTFKNLPDLPIGKVLDEGGFKGYVVGNACVSDKHANFIINKGGASFGDIVEIIKTLKQYVKDKYNVDIHCEIKIIGGE